MAVHWYPPLRQQAPLLQAPRAFPRSDTSPPRARLALAPRPRRLRQRWYLVRLMRQALWRFIVKERKEDVSSFSLMETTSISSLLLRVPLNSELANVNNFAPLLL